MKTVLLFQGPDADLSTPFPGAAGKRFLALVGVPAERLADHFDRRNLLAEWPGSKWPTSKAKEAAAALDGLTGRVVLAIGVPVAKAFGLDPNKPFEFANRRDFTIALVPHPSAMNRFWHIQANHDAGARFLRKFVAASA